MKRFARIAAAVALTAGMAVMAAPSSEAKVSTIFHCDYFQVMPYCK